jgi:hypothetical protein
MLRRVVKFDVTHLVRHCLTRPTNGWVLVSYNGYLVRAAKLYANGHDLKDPQLSPIYGDFTGFPPGHPNQRN